ncbi:MAG: hypothetical protein ABGW69_03580 [Nanoarchaeota archaeon]
MTKTSNKKTSNNKNSRNKFLLPFIIFILFLSASIAYYMVFNVQTYQDDYQKIAVEYVNWLAKKQKESVSILGAQTYLQNDFYKEVYVFISRTQVIPIYVTLDKKFVSNIVSTKDSNNDTEAINLALLKLNIPFYFNLTKELSYYGVNKNPYYKIYALKNYGFYFLVGNKSIMLFAKSVKDIENLGN